MRKWQAVIVADKDLKPTGATFSWDFDLLQALFPVHLNPQ